MIAEPILDARDRAVWDVWCRTALVHAQTQAHRDRVDRAKRHAADALQRVPNAYVPWSGGKDSTALAHLVRVELGADVPAVSEKDDLDYPGEVEYVERLAAAWGLRLRIVRPDIAPTELIASRLAAMHPGDEIHARAAELSERCFYSVMRVVERDYDLTIWGIRTAESQRRRIARARNGITYQLAAGHWRSQPIADWLDIDVYAYLLAREIPVLDVYRCVGLMHAREPWRIRKSWWLPGTSASHGQIAWLRRYYPSLYRRMLGWWPHACAFG